MTARYPLILCIAFKLFQILKYYLRFILYIMGENKEVRFIIKLHLYYVDVFGKPTGKHLLMLIKPIHCLLISSYLT